MKFLSKIASVFVKSIGIAAELLGVAGPLISNWLPKAAPIVQQAEDTGQRLLKAIVDAEAVIAILKGPTGNGADKLKLAATDIGLIFTDILDTAQLKIENEVAAQQALTSVASSLADLLNSCKRK